MSLRPTFEHYFPENSKGGQCAVFAEKLEQFGPVGDSLAAKTSYVKNHGILRENLGGHYEIGDVVVTNESTTNGHVFIINDIIGNQLQATESNYKLDQKVHHTRIVPVSTKIVGVLRGCPLKVQVINPPMPTQFPIQIRTRILMNNQPMWNSLLSQMAKLQDWFWQNSGGKIELILDYKDVSYTGWQTEFTNGGLGNQYFPIIKQSWFDQNLIAPSGNAKIIAFIMKKADWTGAIFNGQDGMFEIGYCRSGIGLPIRIHAAVDEHDDYPPSNTELVGLSKILAHEISHGLYPLCAKSPLPAGSDLTHVHYYGQNGQPLRFEDIFNDFDYDKLAQAINK